MATMTNPDSDNEWRTQLIAIFLIILASTCIALGEKFGWGDLRTFALTFGGAGVGILTAHRANSTSVSNNEGGKMTVNTVDASKSTEVKP